MYQLSDPDRRRNTYCSNCGDTRGGPIGHEASECTFERAAPAEVPQQPRTLINRWRNRGGRVIE